MVLLLLVDVDFEASIIKKTTSWLFLALRSSSFINEV